MSLVKKLKDILFEVEDDDTEPIKINDDVKKEEKHSVASEPVEIKKDLHKHIEFDEKQEKEEMVKEGSHQSERVLFTEEKSFKFPAFDEEEFQNSISRPKQNNNVLDFERKKNSEKRNEYRSYERMEREPRNEEKKKFKPSPIISPVYGILNQDYVADDIVNKKDNTNIDIDSVRKKAFEPEKETMETLNEDIVTPNINDIINETITDIPNHIDEPVVTFFEEKDKDNEQEESYQTVGDLLESASETIELEDTLEIPKSNNLDEIEEELEKIEEENIHEHKDIDDTLNDTLENTLEDTLDNDLFELIDSMYDERKED